MIGCGRGETTVIESDGTLPPSESEVEMDSEEYEKAMNNM